MGASVVRAFQFFRRFRDSEFRIMGLKGSGGFFGLKMKGIDPLGPGVGPLFPFF